jgi:hypothetical protein
VIALAIFQVAAMTLPKLMVLVIDDGVITKVFYPVFPPNESAAQVVPCSGHWKCRNGQCTRVVWQKNQNDGRSVG